MATTIGVFVTLILTRRIPLDFLFMSGVLLLTILGIVTPDRAFSGFANPAVLTIGALLALTAGLRTSGVIDWLGRQLLGGARTPASALRRLGVVLVASSPFVLNTALVAMCLPMTIDWCRKNGVSASKLLIPVSYFSILGGVCTLIGTSTTLVVQAQLNQFHALDPQVQPLGFFEIGAVGLPCAVVGLLYMILHGHRLLPERIEPSQSFEEDRREYLIEMTVADGCQLIGSSVEDAGLRHLTGLFLIEIDRNGEVITPIVPEERLQAGDRLVFTGAVETIEELEKIPGMLPSETLEFDFHSKSVVRKYLTEVVLSRSSPLVGRSIRQAEFRKLYAAAVVAIHRNGMRLRGKIGDIVLQSGDTLLIQTKNKLAESYRNSREFSLVRPLGGAEVRRHDKAWLASLIMLGMIAWLIAGNLLGGGSTWAYPPVAAFAAIACMVGSRCIRLSDARNSLDIQLLMTIAFAIGMGEAMSSSGAADLIAGSVLWVSGNPFLLLVATYVTTMVLTELISNTAVAAIMIPISLSIASTAGMESRPLIVAVAIAASLSFVTPIGYQTNLMVMGPGGYLPRDYFRCGIPLSLITATTALIIIWSVY